MCSDGGIVLYREQVSHGPCGWEITGRGVWWDVLKAQWCSKTMTGYVTDLALQESRGASLGRMQTALRQRVLADVVLA